MNFVALFRPYRVIPNTLNPSFNGLDWAAMRTMFAGCLTPLPTAEQRSYFSCVVAPLKSSAPHPIATLSHPAIFSATSGWERLVADSVHGNDEMDVSIQNLIGPSSAAERWADMGGKRMKIDMLRTWLGRNRRGVEPDGEMGSLVADALARSGQVAGFPIRSNEPPPAASRHAVDSDDSSDEGESDDHARTAWKLFGSGVLDEVPKHWLSPQRDSQSQIGAVGGGSLLTPVSSPVRKPIGMGTEKYSLSGENPEDLVNRLTNIERTVQPAAAIFPVLQPAPLITRSSSMSICPSSPATSDNVELATSTSSVRQEPRAQHSEAGQRPLACIDNLPGSPPHTDIDYKLSSVQPERTPNEEQSPISHSHQRKRSLEEIPMELENSRQSMPPVKRSKIDQVHSSGKSEGDKRSKADAPGQPSNRLPTAMPMLAHCPSPSISPCNPTEVVTVPEIIVQASPPTLVLQENRAPEPTSLSVAKTISFSVMSKDHLSSFNTMHRSPSPLSRAPSVSASLHRVASPSHSVSTEVTTTTSSEFRAVLTVSDHPVSPRTADRRARRALAEKLRLACPQRARAKQGSGGVGPPVMPVTVVASSSNSTLTPLPTNNSAEGSSTAGHTRVNWENSMRLAEEVREAIKNGRKVSDVLPRLRCLR